MRWSGFVAVFLAVFSTLAAPAVARQAPQPSSTVILSSRTLVAASQNLLAALDYDVGRWDGELDEKTAEAVRRFQSDQGLVADAKVSGDLLVALSRALSARLGSPHGELADWERVARRIEVSDSPEARRDRREKSEAAARLIRRSFPEATEADDGEKASEVERAVELLLADGLLVDLDAPRNRAEVGGDSWRAVARELQVDIAQVLAQFCAARDEGNWIAIVDSATGKPLAKFNPILGYRKTSP